MRSRNPSSSEPVSLSSAKMLRNLWRHHPALSNLLFVLVGGALLTQRKCYAFLLRTRASLVIDSDKEQSSPREAWGAKPLAFSIPLMYY